MTENEEKKSWKVGAKYLGFEVYVAREIERLGKLSNYASKPKKRFTILKKKQDDEPDYRELREEFRAFLRATKDNVDLYLWFALANLAERGVDRKYEAKVFALFGHVASTFLFIEQNFDPSVVTPDLLSFLKERIIQIGSPGAFDITGRSSVITQSGEGERAFLESVTFLEKKLAEVRHELSKYFKKYEALEASAKEIVKR